MILWLESVAVQVLMIGAAALGWRLNRAGREQRGWWLLYAAPLVVILAISLSRRFPEMANSPPFSWMLVGRLEFLLMAVAIPFLGAFILRHLKTSRQRYMTSALLVIAALSYVMPAYIGPAMVQNKLRATQTVITADGVCLQQTPYTCGPAAAVTALRELGITANEGELAVDMRCAPVNGTDLEVLTSCLDEMDRLTAHIVPIDELNRLNTSMPVILVIRWGIWTDHYVVLLGKEGDTYIIGDPLSGRTEYTREELLTVVRPFAIAVNRRD